MEKHLYWRRYLFRLIHDAQGPAGYFIRTNHLLRHVVFKWLRVDDKVTGDYFCNAFAGLIASDGNLFVVLNYDVSNTEC